MNAFILLINEETHQYEPVPCLIKRCWGSYNGSSHSVLMERTVVLQDGTLIEDVEAMRIYTDRALAEHFAGILNDYKTREVPNGAWASLEDSMKRESIRG